MMTSHTINRDILRQALNKHMDNDDQAKLDRVSRALGGITTKVWLEEAAQKQAEISHTSAIPTTLAQPPASVRIAPPVLDQLAELTGRHLGERYRLMAASLRELETAR